MEAMERGYTAPIWMTFKQALELGANVRKGEKGSLVVYADIITRTETREDGKESESVIPFMKGYTVFNVEQIDGLSEQYRVKPDPLGNAVHRPYHTPARASTAFSSTLTAGTVVSRSMSSLSLWLMPPRQGVNSIADGQTLVMW